VVFIKKLKYVVYVHAPKQCDSLQSDSVVEENLTGPNTRRTELPAEQKIGPLQIFFTDEISKVDQASL